MNNSFLYFLSEFYYSIQWCYPVIILLFLVWFFSDRNWREEIVNMLAAINLCLGICGVLGLIEYIFTLYYAYANTSKNEWFGFMVEGNRVSPEAYFFIIGFICVFQLLLLFKMFRMSWVMSLLELGLMNWTLMLYLLRRILGDDRGNAASIIDHPYWTEKFIYIVVFSSAVCLSYWFLYTYKKLPYTSRWQGGRAVNVH